MTHLPEIVRYQGSLLRVLEYSCRGENTGRDDEEAAGAHQVAFPRFGCYQKWNRSGRFLVDPGQVSFYQPGVPYQVHHPIRDQHGPVDHCDISTIFEIRDDVFRAMAGEHGLDIERDRDFFNGAVRVPPAVKAGQYPLLNVLDRTPGRADLAFEEHALAYISRVLAEASQPGAGRPPCCRSTRSRRAHHDLVEAVRELIAAEYRAQLNLDDIARQVHASPFSLARIFKAHTGVTIHAYLVRIRLMHCLEMIMSGPEDTVGQVGVDAGFATPSHFSSTFSAFFGVPPAAFRAQAGAEAFRKTGRILKV